MTRNLRRLVREERGSVFVMAAFLIPLVFMVLAAMVVDTGTWYTHKRQLQNRADAGALAAGVQYLSDYPRCAADDAAIRLAAADRLDASARQFAGDPQQASPLHNTEVTEQTRINVEINSNAANGRAEPNTSWNDPAGDGLGPCDRHTVGAPFSPGNVYYVDVGARESNQRSLFGMFGVNLFRNEAHARVALFSAEAGKGFLPIALPDQNIVQAQLRYYRECGSGAPVLLAKVPLNPLASAYQTVSGTTLWGKTLNDLPASAPGGGIPTGVTLTMPGSTACGAVDYIPVSTEVRLAGVASSVIDIDAKSCAELIAARFADCFSRISNIRDFRDNPKTQPWIQEVTLQGGTCLPDALFTRPDASSCTYGVSVSIDWNALAAGRKGNDFTVSIGGDNLKPPNGNGGDPNGVWTSSGLSTNSVAGRSDLMLSWTCKGNCGSGSYPIQSLFLGNSTNASVLSIVRTSTTAQASGGQPGPSLQWYRAGNGAQDITVYPTVGLDSSFYIGQKRVLRLPKCKTGNADTSNCDLDTGSPTNSQSVDCEPATGGQGHDFQMFLTGCDPTYTDNGWAAPWWTSSNSPPPGYCPTLTDMLPLAQPYQCVPKAPGFSPGVIADGIAAAIGNCDKIQNNSCSKYVCTNPNYYDPATKTWAQPTTGDSPRIVYLFIVPYGSYKNTGPQEGLPILDFAAFYVTGWDPQGNGNGNGNPCNSPFNPASYPPGARADDPVASGGVVGYFVRNAMPDVPGDPTQACDPAKLRPCVPVLVR